MSDPSQVIDDRRAPPPTRDPLFDGLERSIKIGAACGTAGFLIGGAVGILKFGGSSSTGAVPFLFAGASGLQTFALGTSFFAIRTATLGALTTPQSPPSSWDLVKASAISGGITGGALGAVMRGRSNILPGVIMFSIFGSAGQWMYNNTIATPKVDNGPKKNFWQRVAEQKWSPMKVLSNEEYAAMLRERQLKTDVEIAVIDEKIAALRKEIEEEKPQQKSGETGET